MTKRCVAAVFLFTAAAFAAGTPINTPPPGPSPASVKHVGMAPLGDGFVGVWTEGTDCAPQELRGMRFDRELRTLDARSFLIAPVAAGTLIAGTASDGANTYVAWLEAVVSGAATVHLARIDAGGAVTVLSDSVPVAGTPIALRITRGYAVFLVTDYGRRGALSVTLLDLRGAVVRSAVPVVDPAGGVNSADLAAVDGGSLLIAWVGGDGRVHAANVLVDDVVANRVPLAPVQSQPGGGAIGVRLASDGAHAMAFWYEDQHLRARALNGAGNALGSGPLTLGAFLAQDIHAIAASDGYRLVFLERDQLLVLRAGFDGTVQSVGRSAPLTFGVSPAIAANGNATVSVRMEHQFTQSDFQSGNEAVASTISPDGGFGPDTLLSIGAPVQHVRKLLPFAGGAAALWTESAPNQRLAVGRISAAGKPLDGAGLRLLDSPYDQLDGAEATDGERLAVVWHEGPMSKPHPLYAAIVSFAGAPSATPRVLANDVDPAGGLGISWNGAAYTITWRRALPGSKFEFVALRLDRLGNPIDPAPVSLISVDAYSVNPRLVSNGSDSLLLWESWYDPYAYLSLAPPCLTYGPLPNELYVQRFSAALTPAGTATALATTTNYSSYLFDAQGDDAAFGAGLWLVSWIDKVSRNVAVSRVQANGQRLDPMNGRNVFPACGTPFLAPAEGGWLIASQLCYPAGLQLVSVSADGTSSLLGIHPLPSSATVEAFALAPFPMFAYTRSGSTAVFVDVVPPHARAVRR